MAYSKDSVAEDQWNDIQVNVFALGTGAAAPALTPFTPITNMRIYAFSGSNATPDELFCIVELLHGYKEGSDIRPHIHWSPSSEGAGDVKWQLSYSVADDNETFPSQTTIHAVDSALGINKHFVKEFDAVIDGTNLKIGTQIACRLFRDATDSQDTYLDGAFLLSLGFHYNNDTLGSQGIFSKIRAE